MSLAAILAAGRAQYSVHYVALATNGVSRTRLVADVAATEGIQRITYAVGARTGTVTVLVKAGTVYVRGESFVLSTYLGFRAPASAKYANTSIQGYRLGSRVRAARGRGDAPPVDDRRVSARRPALVPAEKTVAGQRVTGIKGTAGRPAASAALYARANGAPLPVGEVETLGKALDETLLSRWNEPVHVQVPARSVLIGTTGLE